MTPDLDQLLAAARLHGEATEADQEGVLEVQMIDLIDLIRCCWEVLTPRQRQLVYDEASVALEEWIK